MFITLMTRSTNDWPVQDGLSLAAATPPLTNVLIAVALKSFSFFRTCLTVRRVVFIRPEETASGFKIQSHFSSSEINYGIKVTVSDVNMNKTAMDKTYQQDQ